MTNPFDRGFNVAVLHMASRLFPTGFDVSNHAPETYRELVSHVSSTGRMLVYSGGSEKTIYDDSEVNYAFRAWHDWCHLKGGFDTVSDGESAACMMQQQHLFQIYGDASRKWSRILDAEIIGQALYHDHHRSFPDDQRAFVEVYLRNPQLAVLTRR